MNKLRLWSQRLGGIALVSFSLFRNAVKYSCLWVKLWLFNKHLGTDNLFQTTKNISDYEYVVDKVHSKQKQRKWKSYCSQLLFLQSFLKVCTLFQNTSASRYLIDFSIRLNRFSYSVMKANQLVLVTPEYSIQQGKNVKVLL